MATTPDTLDARDLAAACSILPPAHVVAWIGNPNADALDLRPFGPDSRPATLDAWGIMPVSTSTGAAGKRAFAEGVLIDAAEQGCMIGTALAPTGSDASRKSWRAMRARLDAERRKVVQVLGASVEELHAAADAADADAWHLASDASARAHDAIRRDAADDLHRIHAAPGDAVVRRIMQAAAERAAADAERAERNGDAASVMAAAWGDDPDAETAGGVLDAADLLDGYGFHT